MRIFKAQDGSSWLAKLHDGLEEKADVEVRAGWEVIQFETETPGTVQRITYRPSGWLSNATIQDLIKALQEGETVRAVWKA
ncbi:MAG TPA: hypothetical protein VM100_03715 [Longimicrobiales bacterium]|nr:hypothetical protein [Longimicrobiales bacterium]